tara:strand:+ start:1364 stop:2800 length:1437 start_codon:yes stop_codon:yes gene_type:complete
MNNIQIVPVLLCGGIGSRLWPLSRESLPKQFISIFSEDRSLLQTTVIRSQRIENSENPILICNEEHRFIVAEQMREIMVQPQSILLEPFGRNTAPAITLAALKSLEKYKDPTILVLSADHIFNNEESFLESIRNGIKYSNLDKLVTFGTTPTAPHTGYGYIESEKPLSSNKISGERIIRFIEKPTISYAKELIKDKKFSWNSGIFLFKASSIINQIKKYSPEILEICLSSIKDQRYDLDFQRIDKKIFINCPNVSIDISVMEKTKEGIVIPLNAGWSDIGDWNSVWENTKKDINGNAKIGEILLKGTKNSYFRSENKLVVGLGVENLIVIDTEDALLITKKNQCQEIKTIVNDLIEKGCNEAKENKKVFRPWGFYISYVEDNNWKVKLICVKAKQSLSLQKHKYRSEHWVVVSGNAKIEINNNIFNLTVNESTYIPIGSKHRLSNPGSKPLILIEIQSGSYLGEDDIIRYEDNYGRKM